jgi:ElaA protein
MIQYKCSKFNELAPFDLYQLLKLRCQVFIVEQACIYQDLDDKDQYANHLFGTDEQQNLLTYARIFPPGISYEECSIGRVIVAASLRGKGEGHNLMKACMHFISQTYGPTPVRISAQSHLKKFYISHGFNSTGKAYLEDGIPHVEMIYFPNLAT